LEINPYLIRQRPEIHEIRGDPRLIREDPRPIREQSANDPRMIRD
jgi:hypothetical protein